MKRLLLLILTLPSMATAVVDMRNANYADTWPDMIVPGTGFDLKIERTYNSRALFDGMFGFGWCSTFETQLDITAEGNIKLTECGGGLEVTFTPRNFSRDEVEKTVDKIMGNLKRVLKGKSNDYFKKVKTSLIEDDELRSKYANKYKVASTVKKGTTFYADGRRVERFVLKNRSYFRYLPDGTLQKFDSNGRITHQYDKSGNFLRFSHKGSRLKEVIDNNGRKLTFSYHKNGKVKSIVGPNGLTATYNFKNNDLIKVRNAWKNTYVYKYDDLHNLTRINYPDKTSKSLTYNTERDWVTSFRDRKGCVETYKYELSRKNPKDHYWSNVVKKCGNKVTNRSRYEFEHKKAKDGSKYLYRVATSVNGQISEIVYHPVLGSPVSILNNKRRTSYTYYPNGLVRVKKEPNSISTYSYDKKHNKVSKINTRFLGKKGKTVKRVNTLFQYNSQGNISFARNSEGLSAKLAYDTKGRISTIVDQAKKIVKITYDEQYGKPHIVERPGLGKIKVTYDTNGNIKNAVSEDGPKVALQVASTFNNLLDIISPATSQF